MMKIFALVKSGIIILFVVVLTTSGFTGNILQNQQMTKNKKTVLKYMEGFNETNHPKILSCLTEDVVWELPGVYLHKGKAAFDKEIENEAFTGRPVIKVSRLTEENNIVIAEGTVQAKRKDGVIMNIVFCDVFEMEKGLIKKLTSYLMTKQN